MGTSERVAGVFQQLNGGGVADAGYEQTKCHTYAIFKIAAYAIFYWATA
jgi:hypothetical protein